MESRKFGWWGAVVVAGSLGAVLVLLPTQSMRAQRLGQSVMGHIPVRVSVHSNKQFTETRSQADGFRADSKSQEVLDLNLEAEFELPKAALDMFCQAPEGTQAGGGCGLRLFSYNNGRDSSFVIGGATGSTSLNPLRHSVSGKARYYEHSEEKVGNPDKNVGNHVETTTAEGSTSLYPARGPGDTIEVSYQVTEEGVILRAGSNLFRVEKKSTLPSLSGVEEKTVGVEFPDDFSGEGCSIQVTRTPNGYKGRGSCAQHEPREGGEFSMEHTATFEIELGGGKPLTLKIQIPEPNEEAVFSGGKAVINAEAKVEPAELAPNVTWEVQDITGSTKTIKPAKGSKVTITFDKLPADNNQFGEKTIKAHVQSQGKKAEDQVNVKIFFGRDGKDNPGGKDPNWFYYWSNGVVPGLEKFVYKPGGSLYDARTDALVISDEAASHLIGGVIPLAHGRAGCTVRPQYGAISLEPSDGVDSAARVVAHELEHQRLFKKAGNNRQADRDGDLVLDADELNTFPYCLDPMDNNTHRIAVPDSSSGDSEVLAIAEEAKSQGKAKHNLDWASPGSQSKKRN